MCFAMRTLSFSVKPLGNNACVKVHLSPCLHTSFTSKYSAQYFFSNLLGKKILLPVVLIIEPYLLFFTCGSFDLSFSEIDLFYHLFEPWERRNYKTKRVVQKVIEVMKSHYIGWAGPWNCWKLFLSLNLQFPDDMRIFGCFNKFWHYVKYVNHQSVIHVRRHFSKSFIKILVSWWG